MRGIPPLRRQDFESVDIIEQASQRLRTAHPTRALRTELAQALPVIHGDPVLLRRALDNLLENAHKYSAPGSGPVELRAGIARQGGRVELTIDVVDHGVGIAAADLTRVFQPFFRSDKSRTRATGGLGLGLAPTKRIIEAHEGRIELSSVLGEGTRSACASQPASHPHHADIRIIPIGPDGDDFRGTLGAVSLRGARHCSCCSPSERSR